MRDLVDLAIESHGRLLEWKKVARVAADFSAHGAGLRARGPVGDAIAACKMRVSVNTREQDVRFDGFLETGNVGQYRPNQTLITNGYGGVVEDLDDPRGSLTKMTPGTPWTGGQLLYFFGYSLWMYFTAPYNFLAEGVTCEEVEPWIESGQTWRGLKVTYGPAFPSHSTVQIHYFDEQGLMRRQDYTVDVRQDIGVAHYMDSYQQVTGFMFPTRRRIYRCGADRTPLKDQLLISADFAALSVSRDAE